MQKSRLYEVFSSIADKELKQVGKFVRSPFFNQRDHVIKLFDYMVTCRRELRLMPNKQQAFKALFPNRPFDDHKLRLSMSLLLKAIEDYLCCRQFFGNEIQRKITLAGAYRNMNLPRHFQQTCKVAQQLQSDHPWRNADFYNHQYQLELEQYFYSSTKKRMEAHNLQHVSDTLDTAYLAMKLRHACLSLSHQAVYKTDYHFGLLPALLTHIEGQNLLDIHAIAVYYHCYHALTDPSQVAHFQSFKELIFTKGDKFPETELRELFLLATNYCIKRMNEGEMLFAKEGLDIYKEGLRQNLLQINGILSRFTYQNIVTKAIGTGEYVWAEGFIHQYKSELEPAYQESTFSYNLARLEYERKNYDSALQLLQKSEYKDLLLNLSAKTMAMKIYYEIGAFDLLFSHLDAMRTFIKRKDFIGYHQENYLNTIYFTKKMLELPPGDRRVIASLKKEITGTKVVAEKNWLLEQLG